MQMEGLILSMKPLKVFFCSSGFFTNYDDAKKKFDLMVKNGQDKSDIISKGKTGNI